MPFSSSYPHFFTFFVIKQSKQTNKQTKQIFFSSSTKLNLKKRNRRIVREQSTLVLYLFPLTFTLFLSHTHLFIHTQLVLFPHLFYLYLFLYFISRFVFFIYSCSFFNSKGEKKISPLVVNSILSSHGMELVFMFSLQRIYNSFNFFWCSHRQTHKHTGNKLLHSYTYFAFTQKRNYKED